MQNWPKQSEADSFYGNPRGRNGQSSSTWESNNLVKYVPPFQMYYDGKPIKSFRFHKKAVDSLDRILKQIWNDGNQSMDKMNEWGITDYGGAFNFRYKRGGSTLSMHSWGAAIDFDADRNGFGDRTPYYTSNHPVVKAFKSEGWAWGGDWSYPDAMHFQAMRV